MSDGHLSDSHMPDAPPVEDGHPWVSPGRIFTKDEANKARDLALKIQAEFDLVLPGLEVEEDDIPAIVKNPGAFDLQKRGFSIFRAKDVFQQHKLLGKHFLSYSIPGEPKLKLSPGQPNIRVNRNDTMRDRARERDAFQCNLLKNPFPHMAHLFPFSATSTSLAVLETNEGFGVTETMIGRDFWLKWRHCANRLAGFEHHSGYNVFALNPYAHILFDNAVMALRYIGPGNDRHDGKYYAEVMVLWLPVCSNLTKAKATLDQGPDDTVSRLFNEVETAFGHNFLPRRPEQGPGTLWLCFDDGNHVQSGHTFEVGFASEEVRDNYGDMLCVSYEVMIQLTLRGKAKGLPPLTEGDEGNDDNGGGKRLIKGKGKERASSHTPSPSPPSLPAPPRYRRASGLPRPITRSIAGSSRALAASRSSSPAPAPAPVLPRASGPSSVATRSTSRAYQSTKASRARSTAHRHDPLADVRRRSDRLQKLTGAAPGSDSNGK